MSTPESETHQRRALVDVVVGLFITGTLLGMALPALYGAQLVAGTRKTMHKLTQLGQAVHEFQGAFKQFPPACDKSGPLTFAAPVHVHLLPYLAPGSSRSFLQHEGKGEASELEIDSFLAADDPSNPGKDRKGVQNFAANLRIFSTKGLKTKYDADLPALAELEVGETKFTDFRDGTSNTIMFATKYGYCGPGGSRYASPPNTNTAAFFGQNAAKVKAHPSDTAASFQLIPQAKDCCPAPLMAQSFHKYALQVAMADGSVRTMAPSISPQTWNLALQPNDGLSLGKDFGD